MSESVEQILIAGEMMASLHKTVARFEKRNYNLSASSSNPLLLIFSVNYSWEEEKQDKWNDWDFFMTVTNEDGDVLHSEHKHFGESEPGFIFEDEDSHKEYLEEEAYLKHYKNTGPQKKGKGVMARSLSTPSDPGIYTYRCQLITQFWERTIGEDAGLEKNKTEFTDECLVNVTVR
jgi:hypothetical protein